MKFMRAAQIRQIGPIGGKTAPLIFCQVSVPVPGPDEELIEVQVCALCHTELDEIEGRTPPQHLPRIPGHQVIGRIVQVGEEVRTELLYGRVGVAWIFSRGPMKPCWSSRPEKFTAPGCWYCVIQAETLARSGHPVIMAAAA